jgi:hypothetical protein
MWDSLWQYHLKGTLYEYFRGEPDAEKKMADIKNVYEKVVCPSNRNDITDNQNRMNDETDTTN